MEKEIDNYECMELVQLPNMNIIKVDEKPVFEYPKVTTLNDVKKVKKITNYARATWEYTNYMSYLKKNMDFTRCAFMKNVSTKIHGVSIEIHHSPFTLFDITMAVTNKHIHLYGEANEFDVADEVLLLHYKNMVGLIPLSTSIHELIHSQALDVHPKYTYGYWMQFCKEYSAYFSDEMALKYADLKVMDDSWSDKIPEVLKLKYTVIDYKGEELYGKAIDITNKDKLLLEVHKLAA